MKALRRTPASVQQGTLQAGEVETRPEVRLAAIDAFRLLLLPVAVQDGGVFPQLAPLSLPCRWKT